MKMGIARMMACVGACLWVRNLTGHVVAILTYSFFNNSEYCKHTQYKIILRKLKLVSVLRSKIFLANNNTKQENKTSSEGKTFTQMKLLSFLAQSPPPEELPQSDNPLF